MLHLYTKQQQQEREGPGTERNEPYCLLCSFWLSVLITWIKSIRCWLILFINFHSSITFLCRHSCGKVLVSRAHTYHRTTPPTTKENGCCCCYSCWADDDSVCSRKPPRRKNTVHRKRERENDDIATQNMKHRKHRCFQVSISNSLQFKMVSFIYIRKKGSSSKKIFWKDVA